MGENGRWMGTKKWLKEFGRWVRRIPEGHIAWLRHRGQVAVDNGPPRAGGTIDRPPGIDKPPMSRTRPRRKEEP